MIITAFVVARLLNQSWHVTALAPEKLAQVENLLPNVQQLLSRNIDLERALRRAGARGRWQFMALNTKTNKMVFGFPPLLLKNKRNFKELIDLQAPVLIKTQNMEFMGPFMVTSQQQEYQLYIGQLLRIEQRPGFAFGLALLVFIVIGSLSCVAIAYTITKPLKQLSILSKDIAKTKLAHAQSGHSLAQQQEQKANTKALFADNSFEKRKDEIGQLHHDIIDMANKLAKSLSQQKALMANISHELRTPLTRMQLSIAMLELKNDEQQQYADRIEKEISVMDELIGQSLQLAKMDNNSHGHWVQREHINIKDALNTLFEDLQFEANANQVELKCENIPDQTLWVFKSSLVSAIENVTRNAIKFSKGKVKITCCIVEHDNEPQINSELDESTLVGSSSIKHALQICVEDNGDGISEPQLDSIFEPFYRANSGKQYQGTGLGLAIAKAAVELHNGRIDASASSLGGLRVCMCFPITA